MSPANGEILVFPTVLFNKDNGYNSSNGIFNAPVDGIYLLTIQICTLNTKHMVTSIMVDDTEVGRGYVWDNDNYPCNTADAIVFMEADRKAYVKVLHQTGTLIENEYRLLSFSGALLTT